MLKSYFLSCLIILLSCTSSLDRGSETENIEVKLSRVYFEDKLDKESKRSDIQSVIILLQLLTDSTLKKDFSSIQQHVHKTKGIYVDIKAHWTKIEFEENLKKPDSYIHTYFFDHDKLAKQKKDESVKTVRELLVASGGLNVDLFFEDESSCEVKIQFNKNNALSKDLNNPYFIKDGDKWYIYRLF